MFLVNGKITKFIDDIPAPTTIDKPEIWHGQKFNQTKNSFQIRIIPGTTPIGAPNPIRFFDVENYNANKAWYDAQIVVNGNRSYEYILNEIVNNGFKLIYLKISWRFSNLYDPQVQEPFYKAYKNANGEYCEDLILSQEIFDIYQNQANVLNVDMRTEYFLLDGITYLQYRLVQDTGAQGISMNFFYEKFEKSQILGTAVADALTKF